jgi:hypothetical protein
VAFAEARRFAASWVERKLAEGFVFVDKEHCSRAAASSERPADTETSNALDEMDEVLQTALALEFAARGMAPCLRRRIDG